MKALILAFLLATMKCAFATDMNSGPKNSNNQLLPSPFPVFLIDGQGVINHPVPGAEKKMLPTDNTYKDSSGCYIACYSHNKGIYRASDSIYVLGQVRVPGEYQSRVCQPSDYQGQDISQVQKFSILCADKIAGCDNGSCWAGGDTGGWFGIQ